MRISDWSSDVCSSDLLQQLIDDMFETMYDAPGIGLAAIQVGVPKRLLVIDLQKPDTETGEAVRNPMVFINPQILEGSEKHSVYQEAGLSVPEQYADVERPAAISASENVSQGAIHEEP